MLVCMPLCAGFTPSIPLSETFGVKWLEYSLEDIRDMTTKLRMTQPKRRASNTLPTLSVGDRRAIILQELSSLADFGSRSSDLMSLVLDRIPDWTAELRRSQMPTTQNCAREQVASVSSEPVEYSTDFNALNTLLLNKSLIVVPDINISTIGIHQMLAYKWGPAGKGDWHIAYTVDLDTIDDARAAASQLVKPRPDRFTHTIHCFQSDGSLLHVKLTRATLWNGDKTIALIKHTWVPVAYRNLGDDPGGLARMAAEAGLRVPEGNKSSRGRKRHKSAAEVAKQNAKEKGKGGKK